jgi:hypothetical protein
VDFEPFDVAMPEVTPWPAPDAGRLIAPEPADAPESAGGLDLVDSFAPVSEPIDPVERVSEPVDWLERSPQAGADEPSPAAWETEATAPMREAASGPDPDELTGAGRGATGEARPRPGRRRG